MHSLNTELPSKTPDIATSINSQLVTFTEVSIANCVDTGLKPLNI